MPHDLDIEFLRNSVPEMRDITKYRMRFVGATVSVPRMKRIYGDWLVEEECIPNEFVLKFAGMNDAYLDLFVSDRGTIFDMTFYPSKETIAERYDRWLTDYSGFRDELEKFLAAVVDEMPPDDIFAEWYDLTEAYTLEEVLSREWWKGWSNYQEPEGRRLKNSEENRFEKLVSTGKYHYIELHESQASAMHEMAYIINHSIYACFWMECKQLPNDPADMFEQDQLSMRFLIPVLRHLDRHPCRTCLFELLIKLIINQYSHEEIKPLLRHLLKFNDFSVLELERITAAFCFIQVHDAAFEGIVSLLSREKEMDVDIKYNTKALFHDTLKSLEKEGDDCRRRLADWRKRLVGASRPGAIRDEMLTIIDQFPNGEF